MADLPYIQATLETKIVGQDATGNNVNYVSADANGNMLVKDFASGSATGGVAATVSLLTGGVYNTTLPTLTNGQQSALQLNSAGYLLIAPPFDVFPATQNITVIDSASTTTVVANGQNFITGTPTAGSSASFTLSSEYSVVIQVTGTWTGTLQIEVSMDSGITWSPNPVNQDGTNYVLNAYTGNFTGRANTAGYTNIRLRAIAAMTGTATVKISETVGVNTVYINNAIKLTDNSGDIAVISNTGSVHVLSNSAGPVTPGTAATFSDLVGGQYNSTSPTLTTGQQSALQLDSSGRLLVDNKSVDNTGAGTITALNGAVTATTNGCGSVVFNVLGTWIATISIQATVDGTNWETTNGNIVATDITTQFFSTNVFLVVPCGGFSQVRLIATAFTSGTVNIAWNAGAGSNVTPVFNNVAAAFNAQVVGNVASGSADSGNGIKTAAVAVTNMGGLPTVTAGQRVDSQADLNGRIYVTNVPMDGAKLTYSAAVIGLVPATAPTDVFTITGSATKTIRITRVEISGTTTAGSGLSTNIVIIKRSAANTGGTSAAVTAVPHDSNSAAATGTVLSYTVNPTVLGATVGTLRSVRQTIATTGTIDLSEIWQFGDRPSQSVVLRGTSQVLAVNLNSTTITGPIFDINIEWTEE